MITKALSANLVEMVAILQLLGKTTLEAEARRVELLADITAMTLYKVTTNDNIDGWANIKADKNTKLVTLSDLDATDKVSAELLVDYAVKMAEESKSDLVAHLDKDNSAMEAILLAKGLLDVSKYTTATPTATVPAPVPVLADADKTFKKTYTRVHFSIK